MSGLGELLGRLESMLARLDALEDDDVRQDVYALLDSVDALHRLGLQRLVRELAPPEIERLRAADPAVAWLLDAYGAGGDQRAAAEAALETIRPYVRSHGGAVEVLEARDGVVRVRLSGSCSGCTASAVTLGRGVEAALREGMVGFERLEVQEEDAAAHPPPGPTLLQIEPLHAPALPSSDDAVALNELGAARRQAGDLEEAATAFHRAAQAFEARGMRAEHAAATFNLGLVERQRGDREGAIACFERARALLGHDAAPAAAAARELGAALLEAGRPADAIAPLEEALRLAAVGNDRPGAGAAANVLGLVHLAGGRPAQAVEVLREALACHPRSVRPEDYAMVKANLALAYDQAGDARRARVAARQALGVPAAAGPVREQAAALLERLGDSPGDLVAILDAEPPERWPALLREEAARLADADDDSREGEARAWLNARLDREDDRADELCEHWLGALLELPPTAMEALIRAELDARAGLDPAARARLEAQTERASARFPPPQLVRLHEAFARIGAGVVGEPSRRYM